MTAMRMPWPRRPAACQAAAYFDPTDSAQMAAVIARLLTDGDEYARRRDLGLAQAARFSWARAAAETEAVYDRLLGI